MQTLHQFELKMYTTSPQAQCTGVCFLHHPRDHMQMASLAMAREDSQKAETEVSEVWEQVLLADKRAWKVAQRGLTKAPDTVKQQGESSKAKPKKHNMQGNSLLYSVPCTLMPSRHCGCFSSIIARTSEGVAK
jgi:hypothetical protein